MSRGCPTRAPEREGRGVTGGLTLPPRLRTIADLVPPGARLVDVGTDHAYLPVWLLSHGKIASAIASDVVPGPLDRARQTAEKYGLTGRMDFRLCDGLSGVAPEEVDAVVIAGMGGETIAAILEAAPWTATGERLLVLQPMSAQPYLRQWLQAHGYAIGREVLAREGETLYTIFLVRPGPMPPLTPAETWAGRQSRGEGDPRRGAYLDKLIHRAEKAAAGLRLSTRGSDAPRLAEVEQVLTGLRQMKEEWQSWQQ